MAGDVGMALTILEAIAVCCEHHGRGMRTTVFVLAFYSRFKLCGIY